MWRVICSIYSNAVYIPPQNKLELKFSHSISKVMSCTLVIDDRERQIRRHELELSMIPHVVKRITVGDYAILAPNASPPEAEDNGPVAMSHILVTIERKSLDDFARSLIDGRHDNKAKLLALREETNCRIIYIIEGPEFPAPGDVFGASDKHGGIPYKNIESSIFHMMVRDNISIIRTKDTVDTAKMFTRLIPSMNTLWEHSGGAQCIQAQSAAIPLDNVVPCTMEVLTQRHEKSDHDVVRDMWSSFNGISVESADEYMKRWTLADIVCGRISRNDIFAHKMANGKTISKRAAGSLTGVTRLIEIRLLSHIPGISKITAATLADNTPLQKLLSLSETEMAAIVVHKAGRKLGPKNAKNIQKYFNYKFEPVLNNITRVLADPDVCAFLDAI